MAIYESESRKLRTRAEELMRKLTLDEKIGMVHGAQLFQTKGVERLGIPPLKMSDGPMGVRQEFHAASWIPEGTSRDYVTYLPCNSAALQQRACIYMEQRTCIRNRLCTWRGNERTGERCYPRSRSEY